MTKSNKSFIFTIFLMFAVGVNGQISKKGVPLSFYQDPAKDFQHIKIQAPEISAANKEDDGFPPEIGKSIPVYYSTGNSGTWYEYEEGNLIWLLSVKVEEAQSLGAIYSDFKLVRGAELYIYNKTRDFIAGAFTEHNNTNGGGFATELIPGDEIIFELNCHDDEISQIDLVISEIAFIYRYAPYYRYKEYGDSGPCEVNVNCPEGDSLSDQVRSVARIFVKEGGSYFWCTGALINNVRQDTTPYFLTANHCGVNASISDYDKWIFYFNYECPDCQCQNNPGSRTMTGSTKIASGTEDPNTGSDFKLLLLNNKVPKDYQPYYAGWSHENTGSTSGVGIHHPRGDVKKISSYTKALTSSNWSGSSQSAEEKYWKVRWSTTENGHGVTEPGSSGSPLFDMNSRIVGQLTGGASSCSKPDYPDFYGKLWYSWESNGNASEDKLRPWLDPDNTGTTMLDGLDYGIIRADFFVDRDEIYPGDMVKFSDSSSGNPSLFSWEFLGGNPETVDYDTNNIPEEIRVQYDQAGNFPVRLLISKDSIKDKRYKPDFIQVRPRIYPNPAKDYIEFFLGNTKGIIEVKIFDIEGRKVADYESFIDDQTVRVPLINLYSGAYLLKYSINDQDFGGQKLIIE